MSLVLHSSCLSFEMAWFKAGGFIIQVVQWAVLLLFHCCPRREAPETKAHRESHVICAVCLHWHAGTSKTASALSLHGLYKRNIWFDLTGSCMNWQVKHISPPGTPLCFALNLFKSVLIQVVWSKPSPFVCCLESLTCLQFFIKTLVCLHSSWPLPLVFYLFIYLNILVDLHYKKQCIDG